MRIVTNGCFDLFHTGHRYFLKECIKFAGEGELLVLVNSDRSVRELKGKGRPIDECRYRVGSVALFLEDYFKNLKGPQPNSYSIRTFDTEDELFDLIWSFKPDLIVKGNDRDVRTIVGSVNFSVAIVPRLMEQGPTGKIDISTTRILKERNESQD